MGYGCGKPDGLIGWVKWKWMSLFRSQWIVVGHRRFSYRRFSIVWLPKQRLQQLQKVYRWAGKTFCVIFSLNLFAKIFLQNVKKLYKKAAFLCANLQYFSLSRIKSLINILYYSGVFKFVNFFFLHIKNRQKLEKFRSPKLC